MGARKIWRLAIFLLSVAGIAAVIVLSGSYYRAAEFITPKEAARYTERTDKYGLWRLSYYGEPVAVDTTTSTIYLSKCIEEDTSPDTLFEGLKVKGRNFRLYFVRDEAFDDLPKAVAQGHIFTLLVTEGAQVCGQYNVVFTTLPVIAMEEESVDEENIKGEFCLWDPKGEQRNGSKIVCTRAEWHLRGATSRWDEKKPWKLSLKTDNGGKAVVELLGLGADDDWILNPMNMDDTRIREFLSMRVWNEMASNCEWDYPMSTGEYVELVLNGEYMGVYLLQRRVDREYLGLVSELLLKGKPTWTPETAVEAYEIIYSTSESDDDYELMSRLWKDVSKIDLDNFCDINILLQIGCMGDNAGNKNMFYLVLKGYDYRICMIPWDTDMGFGLAWEAGIGFVYTPDECLTKEVIREEYEEMQTLYPTLNKHIAERWFELHEDILSLENIYSIVDEAKSELCNSGAYERDKDKWGERYDGQDTHEALELWIRDRLQWCDEYYSS